MEIFEKFSENLSNIFRSYAVAPLAPPPVALGGFFKKTPPRIGGLGGRPPKNSLPFA